MANQKGFYIGIDLNDDWTQIGYYTEGMQEPETVSLVAGEEYYRIPTVLCQMPGTKAFCLMDSQGERARREDVAYLDRLLGRSLGGEQIMLGAQEYAAPKLLSLYLKKLLRMVPGLSEFSQIQKIAIHLKRLDDKVVRLFLELLESLGISREDVTLLDDGESFCHFAMNQPRELRQYDNVLFVCEGDRLSCLYLTKQGKKSPVTVDITEQVLGELPKEAEKRDGAFAGAASRVLKGKLVSAAYLTGEGLEGGWMKEALTVLCRGRRVFQGRNLYVKGACYGSYLQAQKENPGYLYFSEYKLKRDILLRVHDAQQVRFHALAEAGSSRYEVSASCQVLLSGEPEIEVWLKSPGSSEAGIRSLKLTDLPARPDRMTRLQVELYAGEAGRLCFKVTDLGFGSWYPASGREWEYKIDE